MKLILISLRLLFVFTVLTGVIYPLAVTAVGQTLFKSKANGSLIQKQGAVVGSALLAQKFEGPRYFHPRPSAIDYNSLPSGGSNLGPTSQKLKEIVSERRLQLGGEALPEMLYSSGSGLDPHISKANAEVQMARVVSSRQFDAAKSTQLERLVSAHVASRGLGFIGEETVNVLELNLALDEM